MKKRIITLDECLDEASEIASIIETTSPGQAILYGIPRGGLAPVGLISSYLGLDQCSITSDPTKATHFIDDLIDSGSTREHYKRSYPGIPFLALFDKMKLNTNDWFVFPWEMSGHEDRSAVDIFQRLLQFIGEDVGRSGLAETPVRMIKAWKFWTSGYNEDVAGIMKTFEDGAEKCDEMVIVQDIPFYSHCEHHMAPFFGTASIGYIPNGSIVGLSKLSRVLDVFAHRLQVQERLTNQVADALEEHLDPLGVGVIVRARHMCMESRGTRKQGHHTVTSAMRGAFKDQIETRNEFISLVKK